MNGVQNGNQYPHSPEESSQKTTKNANGHTGGQSSSEEETNEDDEGDGSTEQDVVAPSGGFGVGRGKRPAIRVENIGGDELLDDDEAPHRGTGPESGKRLDSLAPLRNKKRTFSNVSTNSVLHGEIDDLSDDQSAFPRRKIARRLSNSISKGLLTYKKSASAVEETDSDTVDASENAIASSDEETEAEETSKAVDVDDEDYSGVNLITDDSDLEQHELFLEQQEEELIINEEQNFSGLFDQTRRFSLGSSGSDDFDFGANLDGAFMANDDLPDVSFDQFFSFGTGARAPDHGEGRKYSDGSAKRVRFDDEVHVSDSSSSTTSDLDSNIFPDLMEQDKLPPNIYQMYQNEADGTLSSDGEHSYWDFREDEGRVAQRNGHILSDDLEEDSSDAGSSGYETDMGDTTDEEDFPPPTTVHSPQSLLRHPSSAASDKTASPRPFQRSTPKTIARRGRPPLCGEFVHDETRKAIAVSDKRTGTVRYYCPPRQRSKVPNYPNSLSSTTNNSPRTSMRHLNGDDSDFSEVSSQPIPYNTDVMLSGVFGTAPTTGDFLLGGQVIGPLEAFYPFVNIGPNGDVISDGDEDDDDDDEDDFENKLDISAFFEFGSDEDESDMDEDLTDFPTTPAMSTIAQNGSSPCRTSPIKSSPIVHRRNASDAMLEHFDRGVVTAFRNNQNRYRDIARLPHDPGLRASVSRPVRSGRSAETLISPLRKRGSISSKSITAPTFEVVSKAKNTAPGRVISKHRGPRAGTFV
ncbi:hypothetical protein K432DRAFT_412750 [Lepidopterella palustris CBS 459.81]|uniref:Uncharacterized protein n=1 Tax=Lepidopterella palustris CBS 459.81 TaxID=1314670 RepID=A0A8E2ELJ6_9PEZI|nr:hypothetical protein K432DRAFT_412750 [Lepidopterella palustris CBS 459.81]